MDRLLFLERVRADAPLSDDCLQALSAALQTRAAAEGHALASDDPAGRQLLMIASGIARVYVSADDGGDLTQYFLRAEDFVLVNVDDHPHAAREHVEAVTELTYLSLPYAVFEGLVARYPALVRFYAELLGERSLRARDRAERRRRAEPVDTYESFVRVYPGLELQVPTAHLASYLGLSPNEFMRARQKYKDRGVM